MQSFTRTQSTEDLAQVIPASRQAIQAAVLMGGATLLEPFQKVFIHVPTDQMGGAMREMQGRRGIILDMQSEGDTTIIESKAPVAAVVRIFRRHPFCDRRQGNVEH
jgi:translation elongation factor EF-G